MRRALLVVLIVAMPAAGCTSQSEPPPSASPTPGPTAPPASATPETPPTVSWEAATVPASGLTSAIVAGATQEGAIETGIETRAMIWTAALGD